jgi:hypothetical protein
MEINMEKVMQIKQQLREGARDSTRYKPVSLSQVLRERFQVAADEYMGGDFSNMLEMVLRLYLVDPANYPLCWTRQNEGTAKNKPVTLSDFVIKEIQSRADQTTDGVFARMVQAIIRGFLADQGRLQS